MTISNLLNKYAEDTEFAKKYPKLRTIFIKIDDFLYLHGIRTAKWQVGFFSDWRYKYYSYCLRHRTELNYNFEWNYWSCLSCQETKIEKRIAREKATND